MAMPIDFSNLSNQQLRNFLANANRLDRPDEVARVLIEMRQRGIGRASDYDAIEWNPDKVRRALEPFKKLAEGVVGNKRTPYTEAGGLKVGRKKDDPDRKWIDTYSGIKTERINATFGCHVAHPGADPEFRLIVDGAIQRQYTSAEISEALTDWEAVARNAC